MASMAERKRYSDEERANALAALAANGNNLTRTSQQLGIPIKTLSNWLHGTRHPEAVQQGNQKKGPLADAIEEVVYQLVGMMPEKAKSADLKDIAVAVGVGVDKIRLLRDQPTSIAGRELSDAERSERFSALVKAFREAGGNGHHPNGAVSDLAAVAGPADGSIPESG